MPRPQDVLTLRGWTLVAVAGSLVVLAWVLGRREMLAVGLFLAAAPAAAAVALRLGRSRLRVERAFSPEPVAAGRTTTVTLRVGPDRPGGGAGAVRLTERLPPRFGAPAPFEAGPDGGVLRYRLRPTRRGLYPIGPATVVATDPFGLAARPVAVDRPSPLAVLPPVARLVPNAVLGENGLQGQAHAHRAWVPDTDDVATRDYRSGDPLRRVHWGATARHGQLMVRQEEYQSTPRATLVVDRRAAPYVGGPTGRDAVGDVAAFTGRPGATTPCFDWVVSAAASLGLHLVLAGYAVEVLDQAGAPLAAASPSAADRTRALFAGRDGADQLRLALAALALAGDPRPAGAGRARAEGPDGAGAVHPPSGNHPVLLLTGLLDADGARDWTGAVGPRRRAAALLCSSRPAAAAPALAAFRRAGWAAGAAGPDAALEEVWAVLGEPAAAAP